MLVLGDPVLHVLPENDRERRPESTEVSSRVGVGRRADAPQQRPEDKRGHMITRPCGLRPLDQTTRCKEKERRRKTGSLRSRCSLSP